MNKLRLFYIYKFDTNRLREYNNDIIIIVEEARRNGELVAVGDNQVLRTIRQITHSQFSEETISKLENIKKALCDSKNSKKNIMKIQEIQNRIDELIHIPEYISIVVKSKGHYKQIIKNGFKINNIKYVRLMCGAGHARKNTVIFCSEYIEKKLKIILKNGMKDIIMSHSKYNAYFALYSSATHVVSDPRVCVIPDKLITSNHKVDWVEEKKEGDTLEEKIIPIEFNLWDGMGIISPKYSRIWAKELGINDYIPSAFTIRNGFIKGMVCTMPFHIFGRLIAKKYDAINDIWGNEIKDIRNYDMILTESQFKIWKAYDSWDGFKDNCKKNNITWGISRVSPKEEKHHSFTNYQFVQVINLNNDTIKSLCQPTVDWIQDVCGLNVMKTLLFMSGNSLQNIVKNDILNIGHVKNIIVKALILNNEIIKDPYVKKKIYSLIDKKIKESYIGKLIVDGNFQVMISDPWAFCEYLFGMDVIGLLKNKEHYSYYWNQKNINTVIAMRSPLTWRSEVNKLNLKDNSKLSIWFKYLKSGIIYSVHGTDCMLAADSDYDYDIVMTTNSPEFINNCYGGLPITYKKNTTLKTELDEKILFLSDLYSFNSEIGCVTNHSTSMYCMLSEYEESSLEYKELIRRLKICRKEQGSQIDKAKGILIKDFPTEWTKEQIIFPTDSEHTKNDKMFSNKLVIKKKPYFMRWLYKDYNKKYTQYKNNANTYCDVNFECGVDQLITKPNKTQKEEEYLIKYIKYLPLNESGCAMNKLSKYMESIKFNLNRFVKDSNFDYTVYMNKNIFITENALYKDILKIYESFMTNTHLYMSICRSEDNEDNSKNKFDEDDISYLNEIYKYYKNRLLKICSNFSQLTNIIIDICYRKCPNYNKDFLWQICSSELIKNIYKNKQKNIYIPIKDKNGDIKYLGEKYQTKEVYIFEDI